MKHQHFTIIAVCLLLIVQGAFTQPRNFGTGMQPRNFGVGVIIGEPTGISAKLWTTNYNAFDFGIGWSVGGDRFSSYDGYYDGGSRVHLHMDYLWHSFDAIHSYELIPIYYGIGGRLNNGAGYKSSVAVRGVLGIAWMPHETPIDIFLEIVPSLQLTPSTGFGIDAGFGIRYFF